MWKLCKSFRNKGRTREPSKLSSANEIARSCHVLFVWNFLASSTTWRQTSVNGYEVIDHKFVVLVVRKLDPRKSAATESGAVFSMSRMRRNVSPSTTKQGPIKAVIAFSLKNSSSASRSSNLSPTTRNERIWSARKSPDHRSSPERRSPGSPSQKGLNIFMLHLFASQFQTLPSWRFKGTITQIISLF